MQGNEPTDQSYVFCMRNHPSEPNSPRNVFLPKLFLLLVVLVSLSLNLYQSKFVFYFLS